MRRTKAQLHVAAVMMADSTGRYWGYDLMDASGVRSGVMYPMLRRWLDEGWLSDGWEDPATIDGRPPRRYYELTAEGKVALGALLASAPVAPRTTGTPAWGHSR